MPVIPALMRGGGAWHEMEGVAMDMMDMRRATERVDALEEAENGRTNLTAGEHDQ